MEVIIEVDSSCCSWSTTTQGFLDKFVEIAGIAIAAIAVMLDITQLVAVTAAIASMLLASLDLLRLRS